MARLPGRLSAPLARGASLAALAVGVAAGVYLVFGPTYGTCSSSTGPVYPNSSPPPVHEVCSTQSMWALQGYSGFPAPYLYLLFWSLAPGLAVVGTWLFPRSRTCLVLVGLALLADLSSAISFGAGLLYLTATLPLIATFIFSVRAQRSQSVQ